MSGCQTNQKIHDVTSYTDNSVFIHPAQHLTPHAKLVCQQVSEYRACPQGHDLHPRRYRDRVNNVLPYGCCYRKE